MENVCHDNYKRSQYRRNSILPEVIRWPADVASGHLAELAGTKES